MAGTPPTSTLLPPLPKFNGTCVPIQYPCLPGTRYVDPCDCKFYFLCRNTGSIVRLACSTGTAYDHTSSLGSCHRLPDVVGRDKCDQALPWKRCQDQYPSANLQTLQAWCTTSGYLTPAPPTGRGDEDSNAGAIAAVVVLLLLLAIVIVIIVVYVRKKGNPLPKLQKTMCWQNLVWCWREVICCESDGAGYYYDDDDNDNDNDRDNNDDDDGVERGRGMSGGQHRAKGDDDNNEYDDNGDLRQPRSTRSSSLPPLPLMAGDGRSSARRSSSIRGSRGRMGREKDAEDGSTYHDFGGDMPLECRMSSRRSQAAIAEEDLEGPHYQHAAQKATHAVYDNPAFDPHSVHIDDDDDDDPPPDTEYNPAPPAYRGRKPVSARRKPRHYSVLDAEMIDASLEEEGAVGFTVGPTRSSSMNRPMTSRSSRSQSTPAFKFRAEEGGEGHSSDDSYTMA